MPSPVSAVDRFRQLPRPGHRDLRRWISGPSPAPRQGHDRRGELQMISPETIDRVTRFHGGDLPVVSAYLRLDADRRDLRSSSTRVSSLLNELRPLTKDASLDREARRSLRADVERIEAELAEGRPNTGAVAVFSCSGRGFYEEIPLPRRVRDRIQVDATPWVRPLLAVLDEFHRTCVLVVDTKT